MIRQAAAARAAVCGRICHDAFAGIANFHRISVGRVRDGRGLGTDRTSRIFGVVAEAGGRILGSNFLDERSTIRGLRPITVDPDAQDRCVGTALMRAVLDRSVQSAAGVRLMQSAYHNRSMSLYAKLGLDVRESFATMQGEPLGPQPPGYTVRLATQADTAACDALCTYTVTTGTARSLMAWCTERHVSSNGGKIMGYTTGMAFIAHSIAETNDDLAALIGAAEGFYGPGISCLCATARCCDCASRTDCESCTR